MSIKDYFGVNWEYSDKDELKLQIKALILASELDSLEWETLDKAYQIGLMSSGDTPSKKSRDSLLDKRLLCQTCSTIEGYAFSVTYPLGYMVLKAMEVKGPKKLLT